MFEDYVKEMQDPGARAESEAYLRQLEAEGRAQDVYGQGVQLILPQAGLVIKTRVAAATPHKGDKLFINVCTCDKVRLLLVWDG